MNEQMREAPAGPPMQAEEVVPEADPTSLFLEALATAVGVETVFGDPITAGDRVVIPVAETSIGGGVGVTNFPDGQRREIAVPRMVTGSGGGAGSRPVAAIIVAPDGVTVQPIFDLSKIAITSIASTAGLLRGLTAFAQALRKRR